MTSESGLRNIMEDNLKFRREEDVARAFRRVLNALGYHPNDLAALQNTPAQSAPPMQYKVEVRDVDGTAHRATGRVEIHDDWVVVFGTDRTLRFPVARVAFVSEALLGNSS